jgi:outer membrane protein TolC
MLPCAAALAVAALALAGCASFSRDGGFDAVAQAAREIGGKDVALVRTPEDQGAVATRVADLLKKPLGVEDAVQVALLNNRGLQASFRELGIAEADLVRAGRLPNPHYSIARSRVGGDVAVEQSVSLNVLSLATMPLATQIERRRFARTQSQVSLEVLRLAAETRKAYYTAVAAEESVRYMRMARTAAEASAELARRMAEVGNWSALTRARQQSFYADTALQVARAERAAASARERLTRLLGLWGGDIAFQLPERLPDLPAMPDELPDVESVAMQRRLDLQMVRLDAEAQARNLGLAKATRFVNVLEIGAAREHEHAGEGGSATKRTWEVTFELPIFDFGTARLAKAQAIYMQVLDRAAETAVNARSEVREAYRGYRSGYDIARHYRDEVVPLRKRIAEENLLRYNGMLIGVFELLADAGSQILVVNGAIEALRDFWIARADLDMALIGRPSLSAPQGASASSAASSGGH